MPKKFQARPEAGNFLRSVWLENVSGKVALTAADKNAPVFTLPERASQKELESADDGVPLRARIEQMKHRQAIHR